MKNNEKISSESHLYVCIMVKCKNILCIQYVCKEENEIYQKTLDFILIFSKVEK